MGNLLLPIDVRKYTSYTETLAGKIPYGWGDKVPQTATLEQFLAQAKSTGVDCSGYQAWLVYQASGGRVSIPDYSVSIGDFFRQEFSEKKLTPGSYSDAGSLDGVLRICGFDRGGKMRHVWGVVNGLTCESSGNKGVNRRSWSTPVLRENVQWCYPVATTPPPHPTITETPITVKVYAKNGMLLLAKQDVGFLAADGRTFLPGRFLSDLIPGVTLQFDSGSSTLVVVRKDV